ncbi:MAG: glycosyltransferase family protein [Myxococcota bacterium]
MATIFYGVAGEGRGHAARAFALVEALKHEHEMILYASGHAYEMLAPVYLGTDVQVYRLPDVAFRYDGEGKLSYLRTGLGNAHYIWRLPQLVRMVLRHMDRKKPDLVLSDFEPVLPRAANEAGIPFLSVDHQHFLLHYDLQGLQPKLRNYANFMAPFITAWYQGQAESVVSSFYFPPLKPTTERVTQIGVLLRDEVRHAAVTDEGHLVAYVRRDADDAFLDALRDCGRPVKAYGLGERAPRGSLSFHPIHPVTFIEDLASCTALVTTAGNQLVGESLFLGKPVLALPEVGNFEQEINAHFLVQGGGGLKAELERLSSLDVQRFIDAVPTLRQRIDRQRIDGLPAAVERIEAHLAAPVRPSSVNEPVKVYAALLQAAVRPAYLV